MTIRRATLADADAVLHCLRTAFAPFRHLYSAEGFADTTLSPATIGQRFAEMSVYVAEDDSGAVVGTIACAAHAKEGHLRGMAVLPGQHGQGVAAELLRAAEEELRQRGCSHITLDTTAPLQRAIRFYERNGYRASGKVTDFYGMPLYEYVKQI